MFRTSVGAALIACAGIFCAAAPALAATQANSPPPEFPVRDFFRHAERSYFRLSADGRTLSFMQPAVGEGGDAKRLNVFVQPLSGSKPTGQPRQLTKESARDINIYYWKGSGTILYVKDFGGDENFHVTAVDVASGKIRDLTPFDGVRAEILDELPDDREHILVTHNQRDRKIMDVYRLNVRTGEQKLVAQNPGSVVSWTTDTKGVVRIGVATDGTKNTVLYRASEREAFKPLFTTDFRTEVQASFFAPDNRRFYAISNRGRDRKAAVLIDPAQPDAETVVFEHPTVDLWGLTASRQRKVLTSIEYMVDRLERRTVDPAFKRIYARLEAKLPGDDITLQSATDAEDKFVVAASSDRTPGVRYVYDAKADSLSKLGEIAPWLPKEQMAVMKPVSYTARDGLLIRGYLTLPVGREPKNLACMINPHGGPWARDAWGFNPEVQLLANRGYCVLQMNFRGSTGYGRAFWEASFGQWGLKMQDDITDGVKWLVAQGIADPKRVGIYGGSYGGYATLAGVTMTPDLYAAAVSYVGVSNMFTFMNTIPPYWEPMRAQFYAMVGDPEKDKERLAATSPALLADRIKTPLMIAQGAKDPRVNKAESDQMVDALKKRGVDVEYMVKDNEGHGFRNEENQFDFYGAMESFLDKHLKPDAAKAD
jgi:dipeptidyl aminopeptidase/acylaminoacyl peptidase